MNQALRERIKCFVSILLSAILLLYLLDTGDICDALDFYAVGVQTTQTESGDLEWREQETNVLQSMPYLGNGLRARNLSVGKEQGGRIRHVGYSFFVALYAVNIAGYTKYLEENIKSFTEKEQKEIREMTRVCDELRDLMIGEKSVEAANINAVKEMEETIDELTEKYRGKMLNRIRKEKQTQEVGILYSEMLTDFERIGDHAKNIAQQYEKITHNFGQN